MNKLYEGAEKGDLARLVDPVLSIDEFRSKMGEDKDIVVIGITIFGQEPATDLVNFIEKSYDFVLDADISSGENSDGNYYVYIEIERNAEAPKLIMQMIEDLLSLTEQKLSDWSFLYYKDKSKHELNIENLSSTVITSSEKYELVTAKETVGESARLNDLRAVAGIATKAAKVSSDLHALQAAAGIR